MLNFDQANVMLSNALNQLQNRLSNLENCNIQAADKVKELESRLGYHHDHDSGFGGSLDANPEDGPTAPGIKTWMREERQARKG